jgi:hypothetical protein
MEYKDNKPTGQRYSEFMMPPHFKSMLDNRINWNEPLPDSIAKMFGVRIPSQDKHSAVNLKLVDYLPTVMGSSAMYARELVELSGADFDIDKLYMQIKAFFHDGTNFVEYGKVKNDKEGYKHYIRNVLENATKNSTIRRAVDRWSNKDSRVIDDTTSTTIRAEDIANMDDATMRVYHQRLRESSSKIMIEVLEAIMHGVSPEQELVETLYKRTEGLPEALEMLGLPVTYDEYVAFKKATSGREPYEAAIDNNLLDIKFGLLGHSGMTEARPGKTGFYNDKYTGLYFEPAVTKPVEDAWKQLQDNVGDVLQVLGENQRDIDSFLGMFEARSNIMGGQEAIGTVVLPNTSSSVVTEFKIKLRREGDKFSIPRMNGIDYTTFEHDYAINHETKLADPSTLRKVFVISALITQATDNAKNPLMSKLNLNKETLPTVVTMLSMGVDLESIILMINNPSIKEALFNSQNKDKVSDPGFKKLIEKRITKIDELLNKKKVSKKDQKIAVNKDNLITSIKEMVFDRSADYATHNTEDVSDELLLEKAILDQFIIFSNIAESLNSATKLLNLQTGLGADIAQFERFNEASEELGLRLSPVEFAQSTIPLDLRDIFNKENNMHNTHYKVFREMHDHLTPKVMLKRTDKFVEIKDKILANLDSKSFKMDADQKKKIQRDIVNYLTLKAYMVSLSKDKFSGNTLTSLQNSLIYDGSIYGSMSDLKDALSIKDVLDTIKMKLDKAGKTNMFIDDFTRYTGIEHEDNKSGTMKLESNTWLQFSDSELTRVQNSVLELLMLDNGTGDMYENVMHIVHYLAVTNGMSFGDGSFINVIPTVLTKDLLNSVDKVHELFLDTRERKGAYQSVFGMSFDDVVDEFIRGYSKSKGTDFFIKELNKVKEVTVSPTEIIPEEDIGKDKDELTIDYTEIESSTNSKMLSNLAFRPFSHSFGGKVYQFGSVMHAFQVIKSGKFDEQVDKKYREDGLAKIEGKNIEGKMKKLENADDHSFLLAKLVEKSILQNTDLANKQGSLLPQILISSKSFIFPNSSWMSKATEKGLLRARKNLVYIEKTEEDKADKLYTRKFMSSVDVSAKEDFNRRTLSGAPIFINSPEKKLVIDIFRGLNYEYLDKIKRVRFIPDAKINTKNIKKRDKQVDELIKAGFTIRSFDKKIKGKTYTIKQIEFPAVIKAGGKYYALQSVARDGAYAKDGNINHIIPADSNIAYGNKAEYAEIELEGSSIQTRIAFLFGKRPTHNEIVQYGKDKAAAMGQEVVISADQEQSGEDAMQKLGIKGSGQSQANIDEFGEFDPGYGLTPADFDEYSPGGAERIENNNNPNELSDEEILTDFYEGLEPEQYTKLASDPELQITSAKKVVSLLDKGFTANQIMELLKKCYI